MLKGLNIFIKKIIKTEATSTVAEIELEVAEAKIKVVKAARMADAKIEANEIRANKKKATVLEYKSEVFNASYVSEWVKQDIADLQLFIDYKLNAHFEEYREMRIMRREFYKYINSVDAFSSEDHKELCTILAVLKRIDRYKDAVEKERAKDIPI